MRIGVDLGGTKIEAIAVAWGPFLSGPGLAADHERISGERRSPPEILAAAGNGEQTAVAVLARHTDRLARGLASVINLLDPDVIVLGGGLSNG